MIPQFHQGGSSMKKLWLFCVMIIAGVSGVVASQQYDNLAKLIKSGASEEVVIAYINASDSSYDLSSDEILHLKEMGATPNTIIAAIQHKGTVSGSASAQAAPAPPTATAAPHYEVYQAGPYWRPWRVAYWYPKNFDKLNQALQVDVAGLFEGSFSVNYEYLLAHQHGLVLKGTYYDGWGLNSHGESGELDYRWHFSHSMNSSFIGAFINVGKNYGNVSDLWYNSDDTGSYKQTYVTIGSGHREKMGFTVGFQHRCPGGLWIYMEQIRRSGARSKHPKQNTMGDRF